ncbi:unnamed protein product [Ixodes hexagonus]
MEQELEIKQPANPVETASCVSRLFFSHACAVASSSLQLGDPTFQQGLPEDAPGGRPVRLPEVGALRTQGRQAADGMGAGGAQAENWKDTQPVPGAGTGLRLHVLHSRPAYPGRGKWTAVTLP